MAGTTGTHPSQQRYPPELRERAVRTVLETMEQTGQRVGWSPIPPGQLGIGAESLRGWVRQAEVDGGRRPGLTTAEQQRTAELEREVRELRRANEVRKAPLRPSSRGSSTRACRGGQVHRRRPGPVRGRADLPRPAGRPVGLRRHEAGPPSARAVADERLRVEVQRVWDDDFQAYGAGKLWRQLGRGGTAVGRDRVARRTRQLGVRGVVRGGPPPRPGAGSAPPTWWSGTSPPRAPNRLWSPT